MEELNNWYKNEESDRIWWKETDAIGEWIFSFDRKTEFNMFSDYPEKLTEEQKKIFDDENPDWKEFFKDRQKTNSEATENHSIKSVGKNGKE